MIEILPVDGLPEIEAGDDLAALIKARTELKPDDIIVVAQKVVSKAEGRVIKTDDVRAAVMKEARRVVRQTETLLIVETKQGFICANAGVDSSNTDNGTIVLLPRDSDASAARIRAGLGEGLAVVISDTFGRAWRIGQTNVAIGSSGLAPLKDYRGETDSFGRELAVTQIAVIDEIAAAAELVMGKLNRIPAAIVRGYQWSLGEGKAIDLVRSHTDDLFR